MIAAEGALQWTTAIENDLESILLAVEVIEPGEFIKKNGIIEFRKSRLSPVPSCIPNWYGYRHKRAAHA
jgi:hypothetical protein